jgi:hypothetical protein
MTEVAVTLVTRVTGDTGCGASFSNASRVAAPAADFAHAGEITAPSVHPIRGDEIRALRRLRRENPTDGHVFVSERGAIIIRSR